MAAKKKINIIADLHGHVLAAEIPADVSGARRKNQPAAQLVPMAEQRAITVEVPQEIFELSGPCLHRFFSELQISWPADVRLPKVEVVREHKNGKKK